HQCVPSCGDYADQSSCTQESGCVWANSSGASTCAVDAALFASSSDSCGAITDEFTCRSNLLCKWILPPPPPTDGAAGLPAGHVSEPHCLRASSHSPDRCQGLSMSECISTRDGCAWNGAQSFCYFVGNMPPDFCFGQDEIRCKGATQCEWD